MSQQLTLPVDDAASQSFERFITGPNRACAAALMACADGESDDWIFLSGDAGSGKTHLLRATVHRASAAGRGALYVAASELKSEAPELLTQLQSTQLLAIDDVHCMLENTDAEHALFHLFNRFRADGGAIMMSAPAPSRELMVGLPDLASRLSWGTALRVQSLSDDQKRMALGERARAGGYPLSDEVLDYLMSRDRRNMGHLMETLSRLETVSLERKRTLTVPFVREVLATT